jgi:hypothetical protein
MLPTAGHCEFGVAVSCCCPSERNFFFVLFGRGFGGQFNTTSTLLVLDFC